VLGALSGDPENETFVVQQEQEVAVGIPPSRGSMVTDRPGHRRATIAFASVIAIPAHPTGAVEHGCPGRG
jgi:hypothetical protein